MSDNELLLHQIGKRIIERRKKLGLTQEALAEMGDMTPENLLKISSALGVSADYILTGKIVDKDYLLLSDKMRKLTPSQLRLIENIIDECNLLFNQEK